MASVERLPVTQARTMAWWNALLRRSSLKGCASSRRTTSRGPSRRNFACFFIVPSRCALATAFAVRQPVRYRQRRLDAVVAEEAQVGAAVVLEAGAVALLVHEAHERLAVGRVERNSALPQPTKEASLGLERRRLDDLPERPRRIDVRIEAVILPADAQAVGARVRENNVLVRLRAHGFAQKFAQHVHRHGDLRRVGGTQGRTV